MAVETTNELKDLRNCWLSPKGEVVVWDEEMDGNAYHEELAICIIRDLQKLECRMDAWHWFQDNHDPSVGDYAFTHLEELGWIRLHGFRVDLARARWIHFGRPLTFQQKQKIKAWCKANGISWDDAMQKD